MSHSAASFARCLAALVVLIPACASIVGAVPTCDLEVRVLQKSGSPAPAGLTVWLFFPDHLDSRDHGETDGTLAPVLFSNLPCATAWVNFADTSGHYSQIAYELKRGVTNSMNLQTPNYRPITVHVIDSQGRAMPTGHVHFREVVPDDPERIRGITVSPGDESAPRYASQHSQSIDFDERHKVRSARVNDDTVSLPHVIPTGATPIDVVIEVAPQIVLSGSVVDRHGRGFRGARLEASEPGSIRWSDKNGRFSIAVETLPVHVTAKFWPYHVEPKVWTVSGTGEEPAFCRDEATCEQEMIFELSYSHPETEMAGLRGRVLDRETGAPITGARVQLLPQGGRRARFIPVAYSVEDGSFVAACLPGRAYRLLVRDFDDRYLPWGDNRPDGDCETEVLVDLQLGGSLEVRITDREGQPVGNVALRYPFVEPTNGSGITRRTGLLPGRYPISFATGSSRRDLTESALTFREAGRGFPVATINGSGDEVELDLVTVPGGRICVRGVDSSGTGVPISRLTLRGATKRVRLGEGFVPGEPRDDPTHLCSVPLPPDEYWVFVMGPEHLGFWAGSPPRELPEPVPIESGKIVDLGSIVMRHVDEVLSGKPGVTSPQQR